MSVQDQDKIDTLLMVETPEGGDLGLRVCGPTVRCAAWLFDFLIRALIYIVSFFLFLFLFELAGIGLFLIVFFLLEWFYPIYFEIFHSGQTPGKKRMKIHVICLDGTPVNLQASLIRNFLRAADFLPFLYGIGLISTFIDKRFRRLGDLAAGTVVTYKTRTKSAKKLPKAEAEWPPIHLTRDEQMAIVSFAERNDILSKNRKLELSELLQELHKEKGDLGLQKLLGYAKSLAGRS